MRRGIAAAAVALTMVATSSDSVAQRAFQANQPADFALLGCDLQPNGGPEVLFLQISDGGIAVGEGFQARITSGTGSLRRGGADSLRIDDAAGLSCSQAVAELLADGFEILRSDVTALEVPRNGDVRVREGLVWQLGRFGP